MGAKQSKRSVDISGKEAEGAGEVAAAGAGGEGRVEQLADADALKPQLNGDAHIHEPTDKEKELDSGTPENEKDATTEKENKEQDEDKDKEASSPVSNGEGEQKTENGDSATTPDDGKKPKKEKVKKKWSLRSISFSRKDKPKQEKKQKEEEPKTNGEPEKVPEETAEASPVPVVNEEAEEVKSAVETKDEKTPDTPVTEPITNGSSTPESPKLEIPEAEETPAVLQEEKKPAVTPEPVPELSINGLSLEETKQDIPEIENKIEEIIASKPEETPVETTEVIPVPEIPVNKEVCVEQVPLIEPTPPPLPANPPPSSVASFAATTMAPELTDASLSNTAETAVPSQPSAMDSKTSLNDNQSEPQTNLTNVTAITEVLTLPSNETEEETITASLDPAEPNTIPETSTDTLEINVENNTEKSNIEIIPKEVEVTTGAKIPNQIEESQSNAEPMETGEVSTEELKSIVNTEVEETGTNEIIEDSVNKTCEIKAEMEAETNENVIERKEVEQDLTEAPEPELVGNKSNEIKPCSIRLDENFPGEETKDVNVVEVGSSTEINENCSEDSETKEEFPIITDTNNTVAPPVLVENDDVEFPPPLPVVSDEVDTQSDAMDQSNDNEIQESNNPISQVDSNIIESNIVTEPKDTEIIDTENKEDNKSIEVTNEICKDPLGNTIDAGECNGNVDTTESVTEEPTSVAPTAEDKMTVNTEAENGAESPEQALGPAEPSPAEPPAPPAAPPAGDAPPHSPQDPLPETVGDKMAELITEISPVPELQIETVTSSDVAVAN